ncbi:MAG: hypothetical protein M0T78_09015 [Actinomycetota bacterium]|nr:hypothetical protein [Actinomycetota bacterium]
MLSNRWPFFDPFRKFVVGDSNKSARIFGCQAVSPLWSLLPTAALGGTIDAISEPTYANLKRAGYLGLIGAGTIKREDLANLATVEAISEAGQVLLGLAHRSDAIFKQTLSIDQKLSRAHTNLRDPRPSKFADRLSRIIATKLPNCRYSSPEITEKAEGFSRDIPRMLPRRKRRIFDCN